MTIVDLYLLALSQTSSINKLLSTLKSNNITPLVQARVLRWVVLPTRASSIPLLGHNIHWDLLLMVPTNSSLLAAAQGQIRASWTATVSMPDQMFGTYAARNANLQRPPSGSISSFAPYQTLKPQTPAGSYVEAEWGTWASGLPATERTHPISMLNLLKFNPGKRDQYTTYGKHFRDRVGSKVGGAVKLLANVTGGQALREGWDEVLYAHYPSPEHFASMISDPEYKEINAKYRTGALKDTWLLATMEINDRGQLARL